MREMARTGAQGASGGHRSPRGGRVLGCLLAVVVAVLAAAPSAQAAAPGIPEGAALWYACTQPQYYGPLNLECPLPYDPRYLRTFLSEFQRFTPENEFKMMYLEPEVNIFDFGLADQIAAFARANGKTIRGHTLVWGDQLPYWVQHPLLPWSKYLLLEMMAGYVETVVGHFATHYPGVVTEWDVVNEPLGPDGKLRRSTWERVIGGAYIRDALEYAHAADPTAKLAINEGNTDFLGPKTEALLSLAAGLKRDGVPLDVIGFEAHVTPRTAPTVGQLVAVWRRFAAVGLNVEVTELDVDDDPGGDTRAAKDAVFRTYAEACREAGNCTGFTVWGVADPYSWLGQTGGALLYGVNFAASPVVGLINGILDGPVQPLAAGPSATPTKRASPARRHARPRSRHHRHTTRRHTSGRARSRRR
jgi:GH35 family endo-1,4-beta-xylanase